MAFGEQLVAVPIGGEERVFIADSDLAADPVSFGGIGTRVEIVTNPGLADRRVRLVAGPDPRAPTRSKKGGWFGWAVLGMIGWIAVSIAVISSGDGMSVGAAAMLLLVTPIMGPLLGWGFRLVLR